MPRRPASARSLARRAAGTLASATLLLAPAVAHAGGAGGGGLAWETPLQSIANSITGPVAGLISLLGISVAGGMLIWGGELNEFVRRLVMVVLVIALIVGAASLLSALFGVGAVLPGAPATVPVGPAMLAAAATVLLARQARRRVGRAS